MDEGKAWGCAQALHPEAGDSTRFEALRIDERKALGCVRALFRDAGGAARFEVL
jgi:hypothetical protein